MAGKRSRQSDPDLQLYWSTGCWLDGIEELQPGLHL
eukprot:SAG11_NODE_20081_length_453_cov_0.870056_2_plen_35_part_01